MTDQQLEAAAEPPLLRLCPAPFLTDAHAVHRTRLIERGSFVLAQCQACGWQTFGRRSRTLARAEGRDHEILYREPR